MLLNHSSYNRREKCLSVRSFKRSMKILPDVCTGLLPTVYRRAEMFVEDLVGERNNMVGETP